MPLGEIKPLELTPEQIAQRARWMKLEGMLIIDVLPILRRWSQKEFHSWLYALDPRAALILSQEPGYREVLAYQRDKNVFQELRDYVWRRLYDR